MAGATVPTSPASWSTARQPLDHRRVYIFPSRAGRGFMLMLGVMLLGSINYESSLGYLLTFLLGGIFLVTILHTYRNLAGLCFSGGRAEPVFAGDDAVFQISLDNRHQRDRHALVIKPAPTERPWGWASNVDPDATLDLPAGRMGGARVRRHARERGWLPLSRLEVQTVFPLGLFTAWSYWDTGLRCLVYPRPVGVLPLPVPASEVLAQDSGRLAGTDDFAGFRDYRPGDSPRHIAWKALAREQGLHVKRFAGGGAGELMLDAEQVAHLTTLEARLSQLCKWVLEADRHDLAYGLRLPGVDIESGCGNVHRDRCLTALALYGKAP
jgi:uncharacterized protein (DUF58 family)